MTTYPTRAKAASAVWVDAVATDKADVRAYGAEEEAFLNALLSRSLINGKISVSAAANSLTIALKTLAGSDPSSSDPVYFVCRDATLTSGDQGRVAITAATSLVLSAGSTLGFTVGETLRLTLVGINDGGTFRFGVVNLAAAGVRYPLPDHGIISSTAEGGAGAADTAGVVYTGTAVTSKAYRVLGTLAWITALGTAGLYSAAPDAVKPWEAEDHLPLTPVPGLLVGLTLSNNVSDSANDIDIATGYCTADGWAGGLALTAALTKRSDAAWSVGSGNGGMDTGSKANDSWGYVWLIGRSDTGVVDALFSASATAPTMPAGYDKKRRIGAVRFGATTAPIKAFKQHGNEFIWDVVTSDLALTTNPGTAAVNRTLTAPPDMDAIFSIYFNNATTAADQLLCTETAQTDTAPSTTAYTIRAIAAGVQQVEVRRKVDSSSQVRLRIATSGASDGYAIQTIGYVDLRGQLS